MTQDDDVLTTACCKVASQYLRRGWRIIPIPDGSKAPTLPNWPHLTITHDDIDRYFDDAHRSVGVLLGSASGNLVDVDLDAPEARLLATEFLPPTDAVFGRPRAPASHY